jgi:putative nucleotidyltransferase with HDIG domain
MNDEASSKPPQQIIADEVKENGDSSRSDNPLDPHYPLWIALREKAPGSHKHTQSLLNIVDNVASAVGCDSETLKLATMYHDIGKIWNPMAFTENQDDENIHDNLDPRVSYQILTRHVSDTVTILVAHNFPIEVVQIASQHHGQTVLGSMYEKAKKASKDAHEDDFRYKTERPMSLEALILMLCDNIEAASRSVYLTQKKKVDPATFVGTAFNKLMIDG